MITEEDIIKKISRQRENILIHSYIYYGENDNLISDHEFDRRCLILKELQELYPREASKSKWADSFKDWDGASGFNLPYTDVILKAKRIKETSLEINNEEHNRWLSERRNESQRKGIKLESLFDAKSYF